MRIQLKLLLLLLGASPCGLPAQVQSAPRLTAEQLRGMGQAMLDSVIRQYGLVTDPVRNREVNSVLATLTRGSGASESVTPYIIANRTDLNAFALPGGFIAIYDATIDVFRRQARAVGRGDTATEGRVYRGLLAAVLGHELAHHTLGHTRRFLRQTDPVQARQESRERELAADRVGALYLLWSGWQIQDAMDAQRLFEEMERKSPQFYGLNRLSYVRTHPRSSAREAELEAYRAELKRDQSRFDDAITLISANAGGGLDLAMALLDTVLMDFPYLTEAYHARGTAALQKYLNGMPIPTLKLQTVLPTYGAYFLPDVRAPGPDPALLDRARSDLDRAMTLELKPGTVSNLGLIDFFRGRVIEAEQQVQRAAELAPASAPVLGNLGFVLYHRRNLAGAKAAFERVRALPGWENDPAALFNLGRTMTELGDPAGRALLSQYVSVDQSTGWRTEAMSVLGNSSASVASPAPTALPALGGVTLGMSRDQAVATLGVPSVTVPGSTGEMLRYDDRGLVLFVSPNRQLTMIAMFTRTAGEVEGVRVGDLASTVRTQWGAPWVSAQGDWFFGRPRWSIFVRPQNETIIMLGVATPGQ